jgi:predicted oxidoreductase (fatty acid repression mutant protein)
MWQYTALEYLKKFGLVDDAVKYWYQMPKSWTIYTAETYGKKNEMFKELTTEQNFSNLLHIEELKKGN